MQHSSKLMDYVTGKNSRLDFMCRQKLEENTHNFNSELAKLNRNISSEQKDLQHIPICPSNDHRLSLKYLGRSATTINKRCQNQAISILHKENTKDILNPKSNFKQNQLPQLKMNETANQEFNNSILQIATTIDGGHVSLEKSFTFHSKSNIKTLPILHPLSSINQRSKTFTDNDSGYYGNNTSRSCRTVKSNSHRKKHYLSGINTRMKRFIDKVELDKENNIEIQDFTKADSYYNSLFLSKTDFDWKMKYLYISRRQSKVNATEISD